jgi:endoglucanase
MRRFTIGILLSLAGIFFPAYSIQTPWLHVDGKYFKDSAGAIVILRGVDLPDLAMMNTQRGTMNCVKMIDLLTDGSQGWYARIIRLCISPGTWLSNPDAYYTTHLKTAVDRCVARGVYCIVDWHYVADPAPNKNSTTQFWTYIAPKFKTYSNVFYEIFNENSSTSMTWDQWKSGYAQAWVDLIRQQAPSNIILVGGPSWSQHIGGSATSPITGTNIAYVGHIYPQNPTSLWSANGEITVAAKSHPVMMTEWGYLQGAAIPCSGTQTSFGTPFKAWVEQTGVGWTAWCADDVWDPKMFNNDWSLRTGETQMGGFVKDWLSAKQASDLPGGKVAVAACRGAITRPAVRLTGGRISVAGTDGSPWALRIVSIDGRTIAVKTGTDAAFLFPGDGMAPGIYALEVSSGKAVWRERFVSSR